MRSCQPGPSSWKKSSTSRSMRNVTVSFAPGSAGGAFGGPSTGLVVIALKTFSAAVRVSGGRRAIPVYSRGHGVARNISALLSEGRYSTTAAGFSSPALAKLPGPIFVHLHQRHKKLMRQPGKALRVYWICDRRRPDFDMAVSAAEQSCKSHRGSGHMFLVSAGCQAQLVFVVLFATVR